MEEHQMHTMLLDLLLEHDLYGSTGVRRFGQDPTTFTRDDEGVKHNDSSPRKKRKPGQPGATHSAARMQRLKLVCSDEPVHPSDLRTAKSAGFRIVYKDENALPIFS
jgi:hypothetical protein